MNVLFCRHHIEEETLAYNTFVREDELLWERPTMSCW